MQLSKKLILGLLIKLGFTIALVLLLINHHELRPENLKKTFLSANPFWLTISLLISLAIYFVQIIRWHDHLKAVSLQYSIGKSASSWFAGNLLGLLSPGRLAELGRGFFLDKAHIKEGGQVTVAERAYFIEAVFLSLFVGLLISGAKLMAIIGSNLFLVSFCIVGLLAVLGGAIIIRGPKLKLIGLFSLFPPSKEHIIYLINLSLILCALLAIQGYAVFNSFAPVTLSTSFITIQLTMAALILFPVTIGNLGVREAIFVWLLANLERYPTGSAISAGLIIFVQNIVLPSAIGLIVIILPYLKKIANKTDKILLK